MADALWEEALGLLARCRTPEQPSSLWTMNGLAIEKARDHFGGTAEFLDVIVERDWFTAGGAEGAWLYHNHLARRIDTVDPTSILEIGAGYGGLAKILQWHKPRLYTIVDLPISLFCSWLYLRTHFDKAAFLWGDTLIKGTDDRAFRFVPAGTDLDVDHAFDIAVNTASMGEMLPAQRDRYLALIARTSRHFYSLNRWGPRAPGLPEDCASQVDPRALPGWEVLFDETNGEAMRFKDMPPSREMLLRRRP